MKCQFLPKSWSSRATPKSDFTGVTTVPLKPWTFSLSPNWVRSLGSGMYLDQSCWIVELNPINRGSQKPVGFAAVTAPAQTAGARVIELPLTVTVWGVVLKLYKSQLMGVEVFELQTMLLAGSAICMIPCFKRGEGTARSKVDPNG